MTQDQICIDSEIRKDLLQRLRRIEGQAQGIQRMLESDRSCVDILDQLKSIRSAAYGACLVLMRQQARTCLRDAENAEMRDQALEDMIRLLERLPH